MKVLLVIESLGGGGSERSLAELLPLLPKAGITPIVVCLRRRTDGFEAEVAAQGVDIRFLASPSWSGRIFELYRIIRRDRPQIVHTALFRADLVGRLAALGSPSLLLSSLVTIPYAHERYRSKIGTGFKRPLARWIDVWTARNLTAHFHAVSQTVKRAAIARLRLPKDRVTVVERGRSLERLGVPSYERRVLAREQLGLDQTAKVLLNVGRHEHVKGQVTLIHAIESLVRLYPDLVLLIAGQMGEATAELEREIQEAGLRNQVKLLGYRGDIPELLAAADVFVFPSHYEGMPGAVLEAMALNLPIVASNIDSLREIVEDGGNALLIDPLSVRDLAQALEKVIGDPALASSLGARGREIFLERFTIERSAKSMVELYRALWRKDLHSDRYHPGHR